MTSAALPNFVVVGVSRAGTTTLFNALATHPQVCASSTKETRYFQAIRYGEPLAPLSEYQSYFKRCSGQPVTMECTPDYFYGGAPTAEAIKEVCDPRVAIVLREPISRLISFYRFMQVRLQLPADMTLQEYVERCQAVPDSEINDRANNVYTGLVGGQYARHLPAWLETFPGRCDIYFFDDLTTNPYGVLAQVSRRLGIDPRGATVNADAENTSGSYRSPTAQRIAASAAKRSRALFRRYPSLYARSRRLYEAVNQRESEVRPIPEASRRMVSALYKPWNELLAQQLGDADVKNPPRWVVQ
ncbi:MAG: sulfotransferase domain-containing protein [Frankiaceae bacterium]|nr:sulfotransferase domain-containing protein [Frankiaceae bacterium]MBV9869621.1 sulfotransferase domain-containing protein [Frankiaceae bacterium]